MPVPSATKNMRTMKHFIFVLLFALAVSGCTGDSYTELQLAAARGQADRVDVLLDQGANVDEANKYGKTALMLAAEAGHSDTIAALLKRNAQANLQDIDGMTPLMFAAANGHADAIKVLLDKGADPNVTNRYDASALTNSVFFGHDDATRALLAGKTKLNKATVEYAFLISAGLGRNELLKQLLDYGVDINARGKNKRTALIAATRFGHAHAVKFLLDKGADVTARDDEGKTALEIAEEEELSEIATLIKSAKTSG